MNNLTISELGGIIADFVRVGYNLAIKDYDTPQDRIRQSEVSFILLKERDTRSICDNEIKPINNN